MVYPGHPLLPLRVSFGPLLQEYWLPAEVHLSRTKGEATLRIVGTPRGRSFCLQPNGRCVLLPQPLTAFSAQCSTKNAPTRCIRYRWGWFSPRCPPPYDHLNSGSPEHASLRERIPPRLGLTVEALCSQPPLFSNLPWAVSTLLQTARPDQCVPGQAQDSRRAPGTVNVLTLNLNRVWHSRHPHSAACGALLLPWLCPAVPCLWLPA